MSVASINTLLPIVEAYPQNKQKRFTPLYPKPLTATFLSALACFTGEEFRKGKGAEVARTRSSSSKAPTYWQRVLLLYPR